MKINLIITSNEIPIQYYDHEIQYRKETLNYIGRKQWVLCFRGLLLRNQIFIACAADKYRKKKTSNMIICVAQFCTTTGNVKRLAADLSSHSLQFSAKIALQASCHQ